MVEAMATMQRELTAKGARPPAPTTLTRVQIAGLMKAVASVLAPELQQIRDAISELEQQVEALEARVK